MNIIITCQIPRVVSAETAADDASDVLEFPATVHEDTTALGTAYEEKIQLVSNIRVSCIRVFSSPVLKLYLVDDVIVT